MSKRTQDERLQMQARNEKVINETSVLDLHVVELVGAARHLVEALDEDQNMALLKHDDAIESLKVGLRAFSKLEV